MNRHEDKRGIIEDLFETEEGAVTRVSFTKGSVRGNHWHKKTKQVDFLLSGLLTCKTQYGEYLMEPGMVLVHKPYTKHAYKALEKSEMVTLCYGPRKGEDYETDTFRMETPLL